MKKAVMALSGGMDSATVLGWLLAKGYEVLAVSFFYGSKHNSYELEQAVNLIDYYQRDGHILSHAKMDLSHIFSMFESNLLQKGGEIPEGHYEQENMKLTVVPGRNTIFASIMLGLAETIGAEAIALGIHQGDHAIYPDCRADYALSLHSLLLLASDGKVGLVTPFIGTDKEGILNWGMNHEVPYHLTRTCYKAQELSCGKCGSCTERLEAFEKINVKDPVPYE